MSNTLEVPIVCNVDGTVDCDATRKLYDKKLEAWKEKNRVKTRNRGERGEDRITSELGLIPSKSKGAADHYHLNGRKFGDKVFDKANPTILNARRVLCLINPPLSPQQLQEIRDIQSDEYKYDRIAKIISLGSELEFLNFDNSDFEKALEIIGPNFHRHLGQSIIDWRTKRPKKSLVVHDFSKKYSTYSQTETDNFLYQILVQTIKPDGSCKEKIDDLIFIDKHSSMRFFVLSNNDHLKIISSALRQNAYFDAPKESRYPSYTPMDNNTIHIAFQIRLRYHSDFDKGMNREEHQDFVEKII